MSKRAVVTGITGQDGSYLAEQLLAEGFRVSGYLRPGRTELGNAAHLIGKVDFKSFPIDSQTDWTNWLHELQPDEFYHLAGCTFVPDSWRDPLACHASNVEWPIRLMEAARQASPTTKILFASSSEVFGYAVEPMQNESTPMRPVTPYGVSKVATYWMSHTYQQRYGLFVSNAILFNHESPRRSEQFVSRKISRGVAKIAMGLETKLVLGNLESERDWGFAGDYVAAMRKMLQLEEAEDFVIGSGRLEKLKTMVKIAFQEVGLDYRQYVEVDPRFVRPNEPRSLVADVSKARERLDWKTETSLGDLIRMMVAHDLADLRYQRAAA
jgi:GDPmannose 4,6-dehydratase